MLSKPLPIRLTKEQLDLAEQSAIEAGYNPKYARRIGSRLFRTPEIREHIQEQTEEKLKAAGKAPKAQYRRTAAQAKAIAEVYCDGGSKTAALIAGGYSAKTASANTNRFFSKGSYRHQRFAYGLFMFDFNLTKAAIYAGYSPKWAGTNTKRLMRHPNVRAHLRDMRERLFPPPGGREGNDGF